MKNIKQIREEHQKIDSQIVEDHEFSMARSELKSIISNAQNLLGKLKGEGDLEAWMQSKITKAADYLTAVHDNIASGEAELKEDKLAKYDPRDKDKSKALISKIPPMIILKRKSIRTFPDNQYVGLYYSQQLDKYITVPFGNMTSVGLNEGISGKEAEALVQLAKQKGRKITYGPQKKAADVDVQQNTETQPTTTDTKVEPKDTKPKKPKKLKKEPFFGHPTGDPFEQGGYIAGRLAGKALVGGTKLAAKGVMAGAKGLGKLVGLKEQQEKAQSMFEAKLAAKRQENLDELAFLAPIGQALARSAVGAAIGKIGQSAAGQAVGNLAKRAGKWALGKAAGAVAGLAGAGGGGDDSSSIDKSQWSKEHELKSFTPSDVKKTSSFARQTTSQGAISSPTGEVAYRKAIMKEGVIDQLKELATKTDLTNNMLIVNEEQIDINSNIAEKVIQVYEALNDDNKAKFAKMLGESKQSFQKAVNFALRYKNG